MQLTVKNLGPIQNGVIDLDKELILLTGPNNTGKSYLTYLIHAISQYESLRGEAALVNEITNIFEPDILNRLISDGSIIHVPDILKENIDKFSMILANAVTSNTSKIFASPAINFTVSLDLTKDNFENLNIIYEKLKFENDKIILINNDGSINDTSLYSDTFKEYKDTRVLASRAIYIICFILLETVTKPNTYFFPAERTAINLFAKHITATKAEIKDELDAELIAGMSNEELGQRLRAQVKAAPKYPYAIRSYINFVNNFKTGDKESVFANIADGMEVILTGGKVSLDAFGQLNFIPKNSEIALELHLSSSLIKSLSYLILYLRYTSKVGDQIIIDEPELNLHPDLQISLARIIAQMINAGLKVIISTHSDYLIKEFNNIVLLGELNHQDGKQVFIAERGYHSSELLSKAQVGAYFLQDGTITPINIEENGLSVPTINDAIRRVDGLAEEIFMEMEG